MLKVISVFQFLQTFTAAILIGYIWTSGHSVGALLVPTLVLSAFFLLGMVATTKLWTGSKYGIVLSLLFHVVQIPEIKSETFDFSIGLMFGLIMTFTPYDSIAIGVNVIAAGIVIALIFYWINKRNELDSYERTDGFHLKQKPKVLALEYPTVGHRINAK